MDDEDKLYMLDQLIKVVEEMKPSRAARPNLKTLINSLDLIPEAIEHYFPGYSQSGLLKILLIKEGTD